MSRIDQPPHPLAPPRKAFNPLLRASSQKFVKEIHKHQQLKLEMDRLLTLTRSDCIGSPRLLRDMLANRIAAHGHVMSRNRYRSQ